MKASNPSANRNPTGEPTNPLSDCISRLVAGDASVRGEVLNHARRRMRQWTRQIARDQSVTFDKREVTSIVDDVSTRLIERLHDESIGGVDDFATMAIDEIRLEVRRRIEGPRADNESPTVPSSGPAEHIIEELLDRYEDTCDVGDPIPVETLCYEHPELAPNVKARIAALKASDKVRPRRKKRKSKRGKRLPALDIATVIGDLTFYKEGGLGEVYVGKDDALRRSVAVKFMHEALCNDEERQGQFKLEAEVTGRLEHPGVVPLYGFGRTADNRPFYAMRYIDGETLEDAVKWYYRKTDDLVQEESEANSGSSALEFRRLLTCFVSLCKTIAYAHNRGIVHRDIKPSNVMIGRFGETIVVDWGLAIPVTRDERFKQSGEKTLAIQLSGSQSGSTTGRGVGTPAYMSPEQFSHLAPTPASDIYSLGATLFVVLCGKPPIKHTSLSEIRADTIEGRLPKLSDIRRGVPGPLQAIAYKAMAKNATDRYPTALDLAQDVERFLADEPITAAAESWGLRAARAMRKHRLAAQVGVMGLIACCVIAVGLMTVISLANDNANLARRRNQTTSATYIARSLGHEIDRIWRVLESEAKSPEMIELVTRSNERLADSSSLIDETSQADMQSWLKQRLQVNRFVPLVDKIFVLSRNGTQIGRAATANSESQLGENFSYRNYFTGLGHDLKPDSRLRELIQEPFVGSKSFGRQVHLSGVYRSTQSGNPLMITLTTPVWHKIDTEVEPEMIGLVGTSVEVGQMMLDVIKDSQSWVADLRDDELTDKYERGLLLGYPSVPSILTGTGTTAPRLPSSFVDDLDQGVLHFARVEQHPVFGDDHPIVIEPILIEGRDEQPIDLQWIVITAE